MPARPSRRLGLHAPSGGDPADVPADVQRLRDQLDGVVLGYGQGRLADRPTAGVEGRQFYATDSATLYYDTGGGWVPYAWQPGDIRWTAAPGPFAGWVKCEARSVLDRELYAALFRAIDVAYGAGDGARTFNVPDLAGRAAIGAGSGAGLTVRAAGARGGAETHTLTAVHMPASVPVGSPSIGESVRSARFDQNAVGSFVAASLLIGAGGASWSPGGNGAHNNMQPFLTLHAWIKA